MCIIVLCKFEASHHNQEDSKLLEINRGTNHYVGVGSSPLTYYWELGWLKSCSTWFVDISIHPWLGISFRAKHSMKHPKEEEQIPIQLGGHQIRKLLNWKKTCIKNRRRSCTEVLFLRKAELGFFHFLEVVTSWLVPSARQKIQVQPGWYLKPEKIPLAENRFLQAGAGAENTKEISRQCFKCGEISFSTIWIFKKIVQPYLFQLNTGRSFLMYLEGILYLLFSTHKEKKGGLFTPWCHFSLVGWKFYSLKFAA